MESSALAEEPRATRRPSLPGARATPRVDAILGLLLLIAAGALALAAQGLLSERRLPLDGVALYALAAATMFYGFSLVRPGLFPPLPPFRLAWASRGERGLSRQRFALAAGLGILAVLFLENNSFTALGFGFWVAALYLVCDAVWPTKSRVRKPVPVAVSRVGGAGVTIHLPTEVLLLMGILALATALRVYQLQQAPAEVTSDHVEKLLDVKSILDGQRPLFFPRNTGRELLQFYLAAIPASFIGLNHLALQVVSIAASLAGVAATYLLGKELLSVKVGLFAAAFLAVSRWDITLARMGLRFSLSTLFTAAALLFFLRGLRTGHPREFLLAGLALGVGLQGYSNFRVVPPLLLLLAVLFVAMRWSEIRALGLGRRLSGNIVLLGAIATLTTVPLIRYFWSNPEGVFQRVLTRAGPLEQPLPGNVLQVFADNVARSLLMFNWIGDVGWVHNVQTKPALDTVVASTLVLGVVYLLHRAIFQRDFASAALLVSVPVLLLPSSLSVAFPIENPSFNRASAAIPVVYVIAAVVPALAWQIMRAALPSSVGQLAAAGLVAALVIPSAVLNVRAYFGEFAQNYRASVPNSSELARIAQGYAQALGGRENVFIVSWPHWVDHRALGMHMGDITWNNVLTDVDQARDHLTRPGGKVYLVHRDDQNAARVLQSLYRDAPLLTHRSSVPGKDFRVLVVWPSA